MCGRTTQTRHALLAAASILGACPSGSRQGFFPESELESAENIAYKDRGDWTDNYNMCPGMGARIFLHGEREEIVICNKIWGLISRGGTAKSPLPTGMSQHFSSMMFNARSDTLFEKPTFCGLARKGRSCLIAVDGFFEWKASQMKGRKQPHYVYRKYGAKERPFLLLAGLWTSSPTGRPDDPTLDTFTIITTDACPSLKWLHHRQPLLVWDDEWAKQWLLNPTSQLLKNMETAAQSTPEKYLQWHAVTTEMSKTSYRKEDAIKAIPQPVTVKSFFTAIKPEDSSGRSFTSSKRMSPSGSTHRLSTITASPSKRKKTNAQPKKGTITAFFAPHTS